MRVLREEYTWLNVAYQSLSKNKRQKKGEVSFPRHLHHYLCLWGRSLRFPHQSVG